MQSNLQFHQITSYYTNTDESKRLTRLESELELLRTRDIISRWLPNPCAGYLLHPLGFRRGSTKVSSANRLFHP
jgi:hypothetical protein